MGTDAFNKINNERRAEIEGKVRLALMGVLSSLYESKIVTKVHMGDVLKLFGASGQHLKGLKDTIIDFNSPGFQADYADYQKDTIRTKVPSINDVETDEIESFFSEPIEKVLH